MAHDTTECLQPLDEKAYHFCALFRTNKYLIRLPQLTKVILTSGWAGNALLPMSRFCLVAGYRYWA